MLTTGSKLLFGAAAFALVAALVHAATSGGDPAGTFVLGAVAVAAAFLGFVAVGLRDGDVERAQARAVAETEGTADEAPVEVEEPGEAGLRLRITQPSPWPVIGGVGAALVALGVAAGPLLLGAGAALAVVVLLEWMVQAWSERISGDPAHNRAVRNQLMLPLEVPLLALLVAAFVVVAFSRVLLAMPDPAVSTVVAIVVAAAILALGFALANAPRLSTTAITAVLVVGAVLLLGGGVVAAAVGERDIEPHVGGAHGEEDHAGEDGEREDGDTAAGAAPELEVLASEFDLEPATVEAPAGTLEVLYRNEGEVPHTLVIEEVTGFRLEVDDPGATDEGSVDLEPGTYTLYCDVPGHRQLGMEATLEVTGQ